MRTGTCTWISRYDVLSTSYSSSLSMAMSAASSKYWFTDSYADWRAGAVGSSGTADMLVEEGQDAAPVVLGSRFVVARLHRRRQAQQPGGGIVVAHERMGGI